MQTDTKHTHTHDQENTHELPSVKATRCPALWGARIKARAREPGLTARTLWARSPTVTAPSSSHLDGTGRKGSISCGPVWQFLRVTRKGLGCGTHGDSAELTAAGQGRTPRTGLWPCSQGSHSGLPRVPPSLEGERRGELSRAEESILAAVSVGETRESGVRPRLPSGTTESRPTTRRKKGEPSHVGPGWCCSVAAARSPSPLALRSV